MVSLKDNFGVEITEGFINESKSLYQRHKLDMPIYKYNSDGIYMCSVSPLSFGFPPGNNSEKIMRQLNRPYLSCRINDYYYSWRKLDSKLTEEIGNKYGRVGSWYLDKIDYNNMYYYHHVGCSSLPDNMNHVVVSSPDELQEYCCDICMKRSDRKKSYNEHWVKKIISFGYEIISKQPKITYKCPTCGSIYTFDNDIQECPTCIINSIESNYDIVSDIKRNITNDIHSKEEITEINRIMSAYNTSVRIQQNTFKDIVQHLHCKGSCYKSTNQIMQVFYGMNKRCYDENDVSYKTYGGNGIFICKYWKDDPIRFVIWCLENGNINIKNPSIDRIDPRYEYAPYNCQIIERDDNSRKRYTDNKRNDIVLKIDTLIFNRRKNNFIKKMIKQGYKEEELI